MGRTFSCKLNGVLIDKLVVTLKTTYHIVCLTTSLLDKYSTFNKGA